MTPAQDSLYWREWGAAVRFCKANGLPAPDRHALHVAALGADKSHKGFSNDDFDKVLAAFRAVSRPADVGAQLRQLDQPRVRLVHRITHSAPAPYWQKIARDKFGTDDLGALDADQLTQLRNTLSSRTRGRSRPQSAGL
jgi:hypothetical protein